MARIRTVKPEFWSSEQVMECKPVTRLLFIGIWNFCDDYGNHPLAPKTIKALIFPGDDISSTEVQDMLDELAVNSLIDTYDHDGKKYLHVCGWKHQKIDRPSRKYPEYSTPNNQLFGEHSANDQRADDDGREGNGRDVEKEQEHGKADASATTTLLVEFDGIDFKVSSALITKWSQAFPEVNVDLEIERAAAWAISNPTRAKKDWRKFLNNWLAKASPTVVKEGSCPVDKIIDLYHQTCGNLPAVSVTSDKALRSMIVERWNESATHQSGQNFWQPFFMKANRRNQVFYRGQNVVPRLEALVSRAVFREISEAAA